MTSVTSFTSFFVDDVLIFLNGSIWDSTLLKGVWLPMAENDSYDTFKTQSDSLIKLLFAKERLKMIKIQRKTLTSLCTFRVGIHARKICF